MKSKLYITGLVLLSVLTYSCSNDDVYETSEVKNENFKTPLQAGSKDELKKRIIDSTAVFFIVKEDPREGDPSNPKPPRR
ncbi:hypothetical protein [Flavobacterium hydatis]|jgi:hypothetical protein|uniref:Lipoprotein n=1 Tax=Flavobacterium hydatis TaxID=991 RepID=A0A086A3C7_FLAHY|nr:hypothetical protein [Flavobacterium hydatis]KFF11191.1 hypothetical protein IW20_19820 [Flavobacterium hydatis]OXA97850.1 hypothetical protein B0A62_03060 [Flavobacterium hydatis]